MIVFKTMWLLFGVTPLLARSVFNATGDEGSRRGALSERFLQIARKGCKGPAGETGTCMFNYQCQQLKGQVVGACLDGFLFGACCHHQPAPASAGSSQLNSEKDASEDEKSIERESSTTTTTTTTPTYSTITAGLESILMTNTIPTNLNGQESNQSGHQYDVSHHLPLVLMFLNKTSVNYQASNEEHDWADDKSRQPTTQSIELSSSTTTATTTEIPSSNRPKPGSKRPRPKPKTTTTATTTTTTTTTTEATIMTEASDEEEITEPHANNVLQFLVSNPPAWVLEELMNGNASLTTWYPLPIPDSLPSSPEAENVTSSPVKRKPVKIASTKATGAPEESTTTTATTTTTTTTRRPKPVFDYSRDCGVRPMVASGRIVGGRRSDYGRWPWQVLVRESTWFGIFSKNKCGGVLISDRHVLTAAHCQPGFLGSLMVVLGEWELGSHTEPNTPVEKHVKRVVVHRDYVERTFENDLAILELDSPVEFKPYIVPICLPSTSEGDFTGRKAEVTGWGKLSHNGPTPGVLYEVDVPVISNSECHDMFKKAGHEKRILDSFVCAGYSEGKKDSCEGDSGGPLMIEREDGRWELVGTVSHGIRCAYPNMPGVYMRMTYYRPWIERVTGIGGPQLG